MANERHDRAKIPAKKWATSWPEYVYPLSIGLVSVLLLWLFGQPLKTAWIALLAVAAVATLVPLAIYLGAWFRAGRDMYREAQDNVVALSLENAELRSSTGTLVPPGWNAIVNGIQRGAGQWIPPGFAVVMGNGPIHDDQGNNITGSDCRIWGGHHNTAMGSGAQIGQRPW